MKRRRFVASALGAGVLVVGWGLLPPRGRAGHRETLAPVDGTVALNGWIRIAEGDGSVQLAIARAEMGQGVHSALAVLVAEELDVAPERIELFDAGADSVYANVAGAVDAALFFELADSEPGRETRALRASRWLLAKAVRELGISITGGSSSIADAWTVLPLAAATVRAQLLGAASLAWKLPVAELTLADGVVSHPSGSRAHFGELARQAATTPPGEVRLKPGSAWRWIGQPLPRRDLAAKVDGSARYGIDVRQPGQLYAVVAMGPLLAGGPGPVEGGLPPGALRIVRLPPYAGAPAALAVVAATTWHALAAARALKVQWRPAPGAAPDSAAILDTLERDARAALDDGRGFVFRDRGDARGVRGAVRVEAAYRAPYLAHATMEPMNCTAQVEGGRVRLWAPTQAPSFARAIAAQVAGVAPEAVELNLTYLGGGFGRRLEVDFIGQAVRVALETGGRPVQLLWPREEDFAHDFYRPAAAALLRAELDDSGRLLALLGGSAGDAIGPRYVERVFTRAAPVDLPDKTAAEGLLAWPYEVAHLRFVHRATTSGVPVGFWRSVGHSHGAFFAECFIDEVAAAARRDPVEFRLGLLENLPRHAAVLRRAADAAGWGGALPAGRARGVALHSSFGSIVAMVVEASLGADRRARVHRVVAAIDCGLAVNPGIVRQQVESGAMFGLAAALDGGIDIVAGVVRQRNFPSQPLPTLAVTPAIETHVVASMHPPAGAGEPGVPPLAPALANALFVLTGRRLRELPLRP